MNIEELKNQYNNLSQNYDEVNAINFVRNLVKQNDYLHIEYHYELLKIVENEHLFYSIRGNFYKHGDLGKSFLLDKLQTEKDIELKSEVLFILGTLDNLDKTEKDEIKKVAITFINQKDYKRQYYGIIVIGWIGKKEDVSILKNEMENNETPQLRSYSATALRQIWYENNRLNKLILKCYYDALSKEIENSVKASIIACTQDLLQKKFGIKESSNGEVVGDVLTAQPKAIKAIQKFLKL